MINFKLFDLSGLYSMYESFQNRIEDYSENLKSKNEKSVEMRQYLTSQIDYSYQCLEEIRKEIQNKWDGKSTFSREYIFKITKVLNTPLSFVFRTDSEAYSKYGKIIIGCGIYEASLEKELLENLLSTPPINTNGIVKIEADEENYSKEIINKLKNEGIETIDIFKA